jgi:hypothetical protein
VLAAVVGCALVTAGAFWVLDLAVGGMPSPWWGALGGAVLAVLSYLRTGLADRHERRDR